MEYMKVNELRESFLSFFESKGHLRHASYPLIPENDKSLLLINAGMAPLKPYFTGIEVPPSKRMTTCQKCIRTGDIENVGKTSRHCTFFEMLGNFSFGDYFKEEIIPWSWEYCTEVLKIPADRLYVSVYHEDDEAFKIWNEKVGLPAERIYRLGKEDNFWEVGTGPCGPCSEIYFDRGEEFGCQEDTCEVGCECDRFMEVWNLVFTQFNKEEDGSYTPLAHPNIDTGMGLERLAVAMQGVESVFDIDSIKAVREAVCKTANKEYGKSYETDVSIRIITDHIRAVTFMLADGVLPNNEGRGYVLRRLLRRAARHGKLLGIDKMFLTDLCKVVIRESKDAYPELLEKQDYIFKILSLEESRFYETLDQGLEFLKSYIKKVKERAEKMLSGEDAFRLYDTFGFPFELMKEILAEDHIGIDEDQFLKEMENQRQLSRSSREENTFMGGAEEIYAKVGSKEPTEFIGYTYLYTEDALVKGLVVNGEIVDKALKGEEVSVVLNKTPFYATGGGQQGDKGKIETAEGIVEIKDCIKSAGKYVHIGVVTEGEIRSGSIVKAAVDEKNRMNTARNHTATHLLQKALREILGTHVEQAGSYVSENRLRFDFTHFEAIGYEDLEKIERIVNDKIFSSLTVEIINTDIDKAKSMGAMALFGEKYEKDVRVIKVADYSIELCGGTHVKNTAQISTFKILSESGISAGVRRIEALTGEAALEYYKSQDILIKTAAMALKTTPENLVKRAETAIKEMRELKSEFEKLKSSMTGNIVDDILKTGTEVKGISLVVSDAGELDMNGLRTLGDKLKDKLKSGIIVITSKHEDKANLVVMATDDAVSKGVHAGNIIKELSAIIGGKGGGKANMAQAGGKSPEKIEELTKKAAGVIEELL
jgi:alanyl-tRNA synthetase